MDMVTVVQNLVGLKLQFSQAITITSKHPLGPLLPRFGQRIFYDAGINKEATVHDKIHNNQWAFLITQTIELNEVRVELHKVTFNPTAKDSCKWTLNTSGEFTISSLWDNLRTHLPIVAWHKVLRFPGHISRGSLITWMALLHRLNTGDRLVMFGLKFLSQCTFCHAIENHAHLFFDCSMATQTMTLLSPQTPHMNGHQAWQPWVDCLSNLRGKSLANIIAKLVFTVYVHHIRLERNHRKFQNSCCPPTVVAHKISNDVRARLLSIANLPSGLHSGQLKVQWNIA
ncbi:uncharacterized protein LOC131327685 [Rhododendron vialii]|uniref:uncharacterized protein LOC131327685 n=1 Tax=Rhododendron vialii TaxID=182163 RepID=UPI00265D9D10|nr:uncharacterized protein LOC131327685 [Rhododendron vialii]